MNKSEAHQSSLDTFLDQQHLVQQALCRIPPFSTAMALGSSESSCSARALRSARAGPSGRKPCARSHAAATEQAHHEQPSAQSDIRKQAMRRGMPHPFSPLAALKHMLARPRSVSERVRVHARVCLRLPCIAPALLILYCGPPCA